MWCPNCKDEYRAGITVCPVCNAALVESLPVEVDPALAVEKAEAYDRIGSDENLELLSSGNHAYVEKSTKYEDMKSTASAFLLAGSIGLILLILLWFGVIPLQLAPYMKYMMTIVMGILFCIFFVIGIRAYLQLKPLKAAVDTEAQQAAAAKDWFIQNCSGTSIDTEALVHSAETLEQKYFLRSTYMKQILSRQFPDYEDNFLDYLTEQFYEQLYPDAES